MIEVKAKDPQYPTIDFLIGAIAGWIKRYRSPHGSYDDLQRCSAEEATKIAKDLALPASELRRLIAKGPNASNAVSEMLCALSIAPDALADSDPTTMKDLQRTCILCARKSRCRKELVEGTAVRNFREFCPNAHTLDAVLSQKKPLHTR